MRLNQVKIGKIERLDSHHLAILSFIKENHPCTENQVVKAMEQLKVCSKMTTLRKLDELIEKHEIKDLLKEGESGFHRFVINENNAFNQIIWNLSQIEALLNPIEELWNLIKQRRLQKLPLDRNTDESYFLFEQICSQSINMMLIALLTRTNNVIQSETDAQILYKKNIGLLFRLFRITGPPIRLINTFKNTVETKRVELRSIMDNLEIGTVESERKRLTETYKIEYNILKIQNEIIGMLGKKFNDLERLVTTDTP